jgi:hypothetical protein
MTSPENPDTEPEAARRRSGLIGAGVGVVALIASLLAFSTLAGAQDSGSELVDPESAPVEAQDDDDDDATDTTKFEDAFKDFETCLADAGVGFPDALDGLFKGEFNGPFTGEIEGLFEGEFFDGEFEDKFPVDLGAIVSVMDGDTLSVAEFGDGDGTVTITKSGDDISVSSTGDVTVDDIDFDIDGMELDGFDFDLELGELGEQFQAFEDALSSCEESLPEDLLDGGFLFGGGNFFEGGDFDWDDFGHDHAHEPEDADVN